MSNTIVVVDPTCLPLLLKKINPDGSTEDDDLKLALRNTEVLIFWEPNPEYNCVPASDSESDPNDACSAKTPPKISLYDIFEKYIQAESEGYLLVDEETNQIVAEPLEGANILGGAESSLKYGTLTSTVNLLRLTVYSWGGSFMKGVKIVVPGLDNDHPCKQKKTFESQLIPPCPETDAGFTVGSFVSRIIIIKDTIGSIQAIKDNLMTSLLRSNLYDTFVDSKIYTDVRNTTLESVELSVNYLTVDGFCMFKDVNIEAKGHVIIKNVTPFITCTDPDSNSNPKDKLLSRIDCDKGPNGGKPIPGYGYEGGQIDTGTEGSLDIRKSILKDVTINSQCFGGDSLTCYNCTFNLAAPELTDMGYNDQDGFNVTEPSFAERLKLIKNEGLDADPLIQRRRDAYNKYLAFHNYVGLIEDLVYTSTSSRAGGTKPYTLKVPDPNGLGIRYKCNDYECPQRYIEDELFYDDSVCTESSRSGCLSYIKDLTSDETYEVDFRLSMLNIVNSYDTYVPDELTFRELTQEIINNNGLTLDTRTLLAQQERNDDAFAPGMTFPTINYTQPFRFAGRFVNSFLNVAGDMLSRGINLEGRSLFNNTHTLTFMGDGNDLSGSDGNVYSFTIPSPSRADVNHVYGGIIWLGDHSTDPRAELNVNGFMGSFLNNDRAGEAKLHRTYAFGGLYYYSEDNIKNGSSAIIQFFQPNILLNHKATQKGRIVFNNAFFGAVNYESAYIKGTKLSSIEEDTINLGGTDNLVVDNPRPASSFNGVRSIRPFSFRATDSTIDIDNITVSFVSPLFKQLYSEYYIIKEVNYTDLGLGQCMEYNGSRASFGNFWSGQYRVSLSFTNCALNIGSVNLRSGSSLALRDCNGTINSITGTEKLYVMRPIFGDTFISVPWRDKDGYIVPGVFRQLRRRTVIDFEFKKQSVSTLVIQGNTNLNVPVLTITEFNIEEGATLTGTTFTSIWDGVQRFSQLGDRNDIAKTPERISLGTLNFGTIEMGGEPFTASDDPEIQNPIQRLGGSVFCGSLILKNFTLDTDVLSTSSVVMTQSRLQSKQPLDNVLMQSFSMNAGSITNSVLSNSASIGGVSNSTLYYCEVAGGLGGNIEMKGCSSYYGGGYYHNTISLDDYGVQEGRSLSVSTDAVVDMQNCFFVVNTISVSTPNDEDFNGPYGRINLTNSLIDCLDGFNVGDITLGSRSKIKTSLAENPLPASTNAFSTYSEIKSFCESATITLGREQSRLEILGPLATLEEVSCNTIMEVSANNKLIKSYFAKKITITSSETRYCVIKEGKWEGGTGQSAFEWLAPQEENENQSDIVSLSFSNLSSNIIGPDGEKVSKEPPQSYDSKSYGSPVAQGSGPSFFLGSPVEDNLALLRRSADNAEPLPKVPLEYTRIENSTPGTLSSDRSSSLTDLTTEAGGGGVTAGGGGGVTAGGGGGNEGGTGGTGSTTSPSDTSPSIYSAEPMQEFLLSVANNGTVDWESAKDIVSVNISSFLARSGNPLQPSGTSRYGGFPDMINPTGVNSQVSGNVTVVGSGSGQYSLRGRNTTVPTTLPANSGAVPVSGDSSESATSGIVGGLGGYAVDFRRTGSASGIQRYTPPSTPATSGGYGNFIPNISGSPAAVPVATSGGEYTTGAFTGVATASSGASTQMFAIGSSFSGVLDTASTGLFTAGAGAGTSSGVAPLVTIKIFMDTSFVDLRNSWQKKIHWGDKIYANGTLVGPIIAYDPYENFVKVNVVQENIATRIRELGANAEPLAGASLELEGSYGGGPIRPLINDPGLEKIKVATPTVSREPTSFNTKNKNRKVVPASFEEAKMAGVVKSATSNHTDVVLRYSDVGSYIGVGSFENVNVRPALVAGNYDTVTTFKNSTMQGKLGPGKFLFDSSIFWAGGIDSNAQIEFKQSITSNNFSMTVGSAGSLVLSNSKSFGNITASTISSNNAKVRADGGSENYGTIEGGGSVRFRGSDNIGTIQNLNDLDFTSSSNQGLIKNIEYLTFEGADNKGTIDNKKAFHFINSFNGGDIIMHEGLSHFLSSTNGGTFTSEFIYLESINPVIPATAKYAGDFIANGAYRAVPVLHLAPQNFDEGGSDPFSDCQEALKNAAAAGFISDSGGTMTDITNLLTGVTQTLGFYITLGSPDPGQVRLKPTMDNVEVCQQLLASPYAPNYNTGDYSNSVFPDAVLSEGLWYDTENFRLSHISFVVNENNEVTNGLYASGINPLDVFPRGSVIAEQVIMPFSGLSPDAIPTDPVYLKADKYIFNLGYENDRPTYYKLVSTSKLY